jgi:hypothetical protein
MKTPVFNKNGTQNITIMFFNNINGKCIAHKVPCNFHILEMGLEDDN